MLYPSPDTITLCPALVCWIGTPVHQKVAGTGPKKSLLGAGYAGGANLSSEARRQRVHEHSSLWKHRATQGDYNHVRVVSSWYPKGLPCCCYGGLAVLCRPCCLLRPTHIGHHMRRSIRALRRALRPKLLGQNPEWVLLGVLLQGHHAAEDQMQTSEHLAPLLAHDAASVPAQRTTGITVCMHRQMNEMLLLFVTFTQLLISPLPGLQLGVLLLLGQMRLLEVHEGH